MTPADPAIDNSESRRPHLKVNAQWLFYSCLFFLYFRPADYVLGNLYKHFMMVLTMAVVVIFIFRHIKRIKTFPLPTLLLMVFFLWCVIGSTAANFLLGRKVAWVTAVYTFICEIGIIFIFEVGLMKNPQMVLKSFVSVGGLMTILNSLTMFVFGYHGGMNAVDYTEGRFLSENYFLFSEDNASIFWTWPVLVITWIYYFRFNRKPAVFLWGLFLTVAIVVGYIYLWSMMAAVLSLLVALSVPFFLGEKTIRFGRKGRKKKERETGKLSLFNWLWMGAMLFSYLLVFVQIFLQFGDVIENVFQKSATLQGRAPIWVEAIYYISESPIIGYGIEDRELTLYKLFLSHCHNIMLEVLYRGGAIGILCFFVCLFVLGRRTRPYQKDKIVRFLILMAFFLFVACSVEWAFYRYPYLVVLVLMGHPDLLCKPKKVEEENAVELIENV